MNKLLHSSWKSHLGLIVRAGIFNLISIHFILVYISWHNNISTWKSLTGDKDRLKIVEDIVGAQIV